MQRHLSKLLKREEMAVPPGVEGIRLRLNGRRAGGVGVVPVKHALKSGEGKTQYSTIAQRSKGLDQKQQLLSLVKMLDEILCVCESEHVIGKGVLRDKVNTRGVVADGRVHAPIYIHPSGKQLRTTGIMDASHRFERRTWMRRDEIARAVEAVRPPLLIQTMPHGRGRLPNNTRDDVHVRYDITRVNRGALTSWRLYSRSPSISVHWHETP